VKRIFSSAARSARSHTLERRTCRGRWRFQNPLEGRPPFGVEGGIAVIQTTIEAMQDTCGELSVASKRTEDGGAIQSDAALRQSTEGRQMAAATLSVGVLLAIFEAAPEIRVPFRVDSHHSSKLGGKSQGGRRDRNQPYRESPQRDCITLDRTLVNGCDPKLCTHAADFRDPAGRF